MIQRVNFINRGSMQNMQPLPTWAAISISEELETRLHHDWHSVHRAYFHDVDPAKYCDKPRAMNASQADEIVAFVESVAPHIEVMFVNCQGGISRSAAVARWAAEWFDLPFDHNYAAYNRHVYILMHEAEERYRRKSSES